MSTGTPSASPFKTLSLEELLNLQLPEVEWAVDGILPLGSLTLLAAREKAGKSLLLVDLCCSIALGEPFLDRAVKQGPALLVPAEENIREVRDRVRLRLDSRTDADLYILPVNGFTEDELRLDQGESLARLLATIEKLRPIVTGLDPMRELHNLAENDADEMGPMMRPVRQIAHTTNTALVMNHHMNRLGSARGSTAIRASVDQEWAFRRTDDEAAWEQAPSEGVLRIEGRFGPRQMIGVRLGGHVRWEPAQVVLVGDDKSLRGRILKLVHETPDGLTADDIAQRLDAIKKTVQNTISAMLKERPAKILSVGRGVTVAPRRIVAVDPLLFDEDSVPDVPRNTGNEYSRSQTLRESGTGIPPAPGICTTSGCQNEKAPGTSWFCQHCLDAAQARKGAAA